VNPTVIAIMVWFAVTRWSDNTQLIRDAVVEGLTSGSWWRTSA